MAITAIIGEGGAGKTSLETYFMKRCVLDEGNQRLRKCIEQINGFNKGRASPLSLPDKPPIYSNYDVKIPVGYRRTFTPYYLNPYYFGIPNIDKDVQAVMPWGVCFFAETDKIYDSREKSLPEAVSAIYNKQRHFWLEIYLELHRGMNADTLVRSNIHKFIEIESQENKTNSYGGIVRTTWHCREFEGYKNYMQYLNTDGRAKTYTRTVYCHEGDIFAYFNTRSCAREFIPKDGQDFSLLKQASEIKDLNKLPPEVKKYYTQSEPKNWRQKKEK